MAEISCNSILECGFLQLPNSTANTDRYSCFSICIDNNTGAKDEIRPKAESTRLWTIRTNVVFELFVKGLSLQRWQFIMCWSLRQSTLLQVRAANLARSSYRGRLRDLLHRIPPPSTGTWRWKVSSHQAEDARELWCDMSNLRIFCDSNLVFTLRAECTRLHAASSPGGIPDTQLCSSRHSLWHRLWRSRYKSYSSRELPMNCAILICDL